MANKSITVTEPISTDVRDIRIVLNDAGQIIKLGGTFAVATSDGSVTHNDMFNFDPGALPVGMAKIVTDLVNLSLTQLKTEHGF